MNLIIGAAIGLAITFVVASFFGFGRPRTSGGEFGSAFALAFRFVAEVVLVAVFAGALVATAVLNTTPAWELFGGYAAVRVIALVLELVRR
jgi:hypothetical protein